jgi:bacterioferritin
MHHMDLLGEMIINMGTEPIFTAYPPNTFNWWTARYVDYSNTPQRMLMSDIQGEINAIEDYQSMLKKLRNEQVAAVISRIILDEKVHLARFKEILEEFTENKRY